MAIQQDGAKSLQRTLIARACSWFALVLEMMPATTTESDDEVVCKSHLAEPRPERRDILRRIIGAASFRTAWLARFYASASRMTK